VPGTSGEENAAAALVAVESLREPWRSATRNGFFYSLVMCKKIKVIDTCYVIGYIFINDTEL